MTISSFFQVSQDGKALLDKLQRPLTPGSADSLTASANYSKAVHHVLDIIHEVLHHQRQLENIWQHRKVRLHQRLQLCVFQQDVQQVSETSTCFCLCACLFVFVMNFIFKKKRPFFCFKVRCSDRNLKMTGYLTG